MKIYFAGSIRGSAANLDDYVGIINLLKNHGQVLTEHIKDKAIAGLGENLDARDIFDRDVNWVKEADFVVAEVSAPSLGVGYEIGIAEQYGKKILCLFNPDGNKKLSAMVAGNSNLKISNYSNLSEVEKIIDKFLK